MKICLTFFFLCFGYYLSAQTFLGPTIGYDFAILETQRIFQEGTLIDNSYWQDRLLIERAYNDSPSGRRSIAFGFQAQKMLSSQWSLGFRGSYTKKEYIERVDTFVPLALEPIYSQPYQQISLSILFNRKIKDKISLGIGPNIAYFTKWGSNTHTLKFSQYRVNKRAYGLDLQLGYYLGPVYLAVDYTQTLKVVDSSNYLRGTYSLAISGTYFFELKKRK